MDLTDSIRDLGDGATRAGMVVERMLGTLNVRPFTASADTEFAAGVTMVPQASGVNIPLPATAALQSWLWWLGTILFQGALERMREYPIESKSKRRFRDGDSRLLFIIENHDPTNSMFWNIGMRILFKLP